MWKCIYLLGRERRKAVGFEKQAVLQSLGQLVVYYISLKCLT